MVNRIKLIIPEDKSINYIYDSLSRITSIIDINAKPYNYKYDSLGRRVKTTLPNQTVTSYTYDALSNLLSLSNKRSGTANSHSEIISSYLYEYDKAGNKLAKSEPNLKTSYTYDSLYRLTQAIPVKLKDNGKEKEKKNRFENYTYDPFGRRIKKTVEEREEGETEAKTTTYVYDNEDIILEYLTKTDEEGTKTEVYRFTHGPGIDEPISSMKGGQGTVHEIYYYHSDGLGSITELTDQNGKTVESYEYDSFGNLKRYGDKVKNTFTYTGREYDKETGLYYYRNRYYDPKIGRFITQDPIGILDDINLYAYVGNSPVNFVDPWGWGKQRNKSWWEKLEEGYYYGTGFGTKATEWYAQQQLETENPLWAIPGSITSLWMPETWMTTAQVLVYSYQIGSYLGRPYY